MQIHTFPYSELSVRSYLVLDEESRHCAVIDPVRVVEPIVKFISEHGLILKAILETHVHADFISGAKELKHHYHGRPVIHCSVEGGEEWLPDYADISVREGDKVMLGEVELRVVHTPGHTLEHVSWLCYNKNQLQAVFTGDFLFIGSVGRPDLLGVELTSILTDHLYESLFEKTKDWPDHLIMYPGHGPGSLCGKAIGSGEYSTIGHERATNPAFKWRERNKWITELLQGIPKKPASFDRIKKLNTQGAPIMERLPSIADAASSATIIDFRPALEFADGHLKNSINVPFGPSTPQWISKLKIEQPVTVILSSDSQGEQIQNFLHVLGFDKLHFLVWTSGLGAEKLPLIEPEELQSALEKDEKIVVVDVRTQDEWDAGHLDKAKHIELGEVQKNIAAIPKDAKMIAMCRSGQRSSIAASLLKRYGFNDVSHLKGGILAWSEAQLPLTKD